jgi:transcriptional regulator GlxA family with amidase domain
LRIVRSLVELREAEPRATSLPHDSRRLTVAFVLARRFTMTPFALFADVLRLAGDDGDRSRRIRFDWQILGESGLPIEASCGGRILPSAPLDPRVGYDAVVVVGGLLDHLLPIPRSMESFLLAAVARGTPLIGLCTGSFILAELGLLAKRRASVSWFHIHTFRARYPEVLASAEALYVPDESFATCAGGVGAADLAAEFVRKHLGSPHVDNAAKILLIDRLRDPRAPQPNAGPFLAARDILVRRGLLFMESNLVEVRSLAAVATHLGCTPRQLQRRFKADLGLSPSQAYMTMRLKAASRLLRQTDVPVEFVGHAVGFLNSSHFSRAFRRHVGHSPRHFRSHLPIGSTPSSGE